MRPSRQSILLFFGLLLVYNLNLRQVSSHDTYASRFVPISILRDGDLILDEFVPETIKQQAGADFFSDYFHYVRGHFYDSHPPIGPLDRLSRASVMCGVKRRVSRPSPAASQAASIFCRRR